MPRFETAGIFTLGSALRSQSCVQDVEQVIELLKGGDIGDYVGEYSRNFKGELMERYVCMYHIL